MSGLVISQAPRTLDRVEDLEARLLVEAVFQRYGLDFRGYRKLERRIIHFMREEGLDSISELQGKVLRDSQCLERLLGYLFVKVTSLFRDPTFFRALRRRVVPLLRTYPFLRVWLAGCATGEEAYSMSILLEEEGVYDRARIYATDLDAGALAQAEEGLFPASSLEADADNYLLSGGRGSFTDYYRLNGGRLRMLPSLRRNLVFAQHNLACDESFNEFHLILCRNVLIYFGRPLQERVHRLLYRSLVPFGFLGLGAKESIRLTPHDPCYLEVEPGIKLYRKSR